MENVEVQKIKTNTNFMPPLLAKFITIVIIIGLLLLPNSAIRGLIQERESTKFAAISEITKTWGNSQMVGGPVLTIPFKEITADGVNKFKTTIKYAHFLPEKLNITGKLSPEKKYRGIYKVILYNSKLQITGNFKMPDLSKLNIANENYLFDKAFLSIGISDLVGIKESVYIDLNGQRTAMNPGIVTSDIFSEGISVPVDISKDIQFSTMINLNGSEEMNFLPYGKDTKVILNANWKDPSFIGAFSPDQKEIDSEKFTAQWNVSEFNRNFSQQGIGNFINNKSDLTEKSFGVKLIETADEYQKTMRSSKYDYLFFILTFTAFFLIEILANIKIHPIQYVLVGIAICLFYLQLLSISEHLSFNWAYAIACSSVLGLVMFYTKYVFNSVRFSLSFTLALALLYGFFYTLLQAESYSLLLGSIGLLLILGLIMFITRKLDWYKSFTK